MKLDVVDADADGVFRTERLGGQVRVCVGIKNTGEKAAGPTVINALVPQGTNNLIWTLRNGTRHPVVPHLQDYTDEELVDDEGQRFTSTYLVREIPRVPMRTHMVLYFGMDYVLLPNARWLAPVRVRVESDDMPDDQTEVVEDLLVIVELDSSTGTD